jgi:hypothetical protein
MARNFIILSLGQLTKSDPMKSVHAFTALSVSKCSFPHFIAYPFHFIRTLAIYGWDMSFGKHYINAYKLGNQSTDGFLSFLESKFGGTNEQLKAAWNAMCVVDENSLKDIETVLTLSSEDLEVKREGSETVFYNVMPVVVSATNPIHFEFIKEQVKEKLQVDGTRVDNFFASITKSYDKGLNNLNQTALANTALAQFKPVAGTDRIISLHSVIKPEGCTLPSRFDPSKARLEEIVKGLTSAFVSVTGVSK